jgi:small GTP-binding protein
MKNYNVAVFGLDNAGKTTLSLRLDRDKSFPIKAKWGFSTKKVVVKIKKYFKCCILIPYKHKVCLTFFDLAGDVKIRSIWPSYYRDVYGCIFVIDANDPLRFLEAKEALFTVAKDPIMQGKPFLVVLNVKDRKTAVPLEEVQAFLNLCSLGTNGDDIFVIESEMNFALSSLFQGKGTND